MPRERLSMRKIRESLRWKWELGRSHREVAGAFGVSVGKVSSTVSRAEALGLDWAAVLDLPDDVLDARPITSFSADNYHYPALSSHP